MRTKQEIRPITKRQIKLIHILKSEIGFSDEIYRGALYEAFGVTTCKDLTESQAAGVIEYFEQEASRSGDRNKKTERYYSAFGQRPEHATPRQLKYINDLWNQVSRAKPDRREAALRKFLMRQAGVMDLRFLKRTAATKVISALKAMKQQARYKS